ncbi:MAG: phage major capsid protein, partial [Candidatus Nanopelagicales bacterium]
MAFDSIITRAETGSDLPDLLASELVGTITRASAALTLGTKVPTTTKDSRVPVLTEAPEASWAASDTALRPTTAAAWTPQTLMAEELSCIIPVPNSVLADSEFNVWEALKPLLTRAAARAIDAAILFGTNAPASWTSESLYADAVAAGNVATTPASGDVVPELLSVAELIGVDGYAPSAAVVRPGFQFRMARARADAVTVNPGAPFPLTVAGLGLYVDPPYFETTLTDAIL